MSNPSIEGQDNVFILRLRETIVKHFSNDQFSVEQLSSEIGLSRSQLYRRLKQINGLTISQFIRQVRLEEAKKMLINDAAAISEIAYRVGFNSSAYFHKCFHEFFGLTPGEMKKFAAHRRETEEDEPAVSPTDKAADLLNGERPTEQPPLPKANGFSQSDWKKERLLLPIFLLLTVLTGGFLSQFLGKEHKAYHLIAVLPMEYLPASLEQAYWVKALDEAFREELERIPTIRVLSRASSSGVIKRNMLLPEMARELQVDAIIEGSVLLRGDSVWVRMSLIKTHPVEQQIWAGEYLEHLDEINSSHKALVAYLAQQISLSFAETTEQN